MIEIRSLKKKIADKQKKRDTWKYEIKTADTHKTHKKTAALMSNFFKKKKIILTACTA